MVVGSHLALKEAAHARGIPYLMIVNGVPQHSRRELGALIDKAISATNRAEAVVLVSQANFEALGRIYPEISSKKIVPLLRFEWVTSGKYGRHPTVRPGRPSLRPDHAV
jgi:hypothetical protein